MMNLSLLFLSTRKRNVRLHLRNASAVDINMEKLQSVQPLECVLTLNPAQIAVKRDIVLREGHSPKEMSGVIIAAINSIHQLQTLPTIWIDINNCHVSAVPNTGAQVTVAGISYLHQFGLSEIHLRKPSHALKHVGGGYIAVVGSYDLTITYKNMILEEPVYFVKGLDLVFLSLHACKCFRLVHQSFPYIQLQDDENGDVQIAYCQMKRMTGDSANHLSNHQSQHTKVESSHMQHSLPDRPERIPPRLNIS